MGGSPLLLMGADMLERGGAIVIDGPHDHPAAEALAAVGASRSRPVVDRAAPRPAPLAGGLAARRLPQAAGARRDALPGPDLQPAGHDAGDAGGALEGTGDGGGLADAE